MGPIDHLKFCVERGQLLDLLNRATEEYAQAANSLAYKMSTMWEAEDRRERAGLDAEHAREALLQHRQEHGC